MANRFRPSRRAGRTPEAILRRIVRSDNPVRLAACAAVMSSICHLIVQRRESSGDVITLALPRPTVLAGYHGLPDRHKVSGHDTATLAITLPVSGQLAQ